MGAALQEQRAYQEGKQDRFRINVKISLEEYDQLIQIIQERSSFKNPYLCTVDHMLTNHSSSTIFCENSKEVIIEYENYDYLLSEAFKDKPFPPVEIQKIIFGVCSGLIFLFSKKYRHGDIQSKSVCNYRGEWKLLDNYFIKRGISAYQKVLEGENGFISPAQMQKIRHGFIRQSPAIEQSDQIFALGMTCLQLMTGKPSRECYKQSYIRFNEQKLNESLNFINRFYPPYFAGLVQGMLVMNEQRRITIRQIMNQSFIHRHSKKLSLRPTQRP